MSAKPASVPPTESARQGGARGLAALLFAPSPHILDVDERRRARLLAVSLFLMALALVVGVLSRMAVRGEIGWEMIASVPVLAIAYWMSRTRLLWIAGTLGLVALSFPSFFMAHDQAHTDPETARHALVWLALPLFFSSFVMKVRGTVIACTAVLLGVVASMLFFPESMFEPVVMALSVLIATAGLTIGVAVVQRRVQRVAERELRRREKVEAELRSARDELEVRVADRTAELEEASEKLRHSQKLEAVGQLAGGVAHDFNNLLMVIQGYTEEVLAELDDDGTNSADLREVLEASNKAAVLTRQLLAFSRRQVLRPKPVDLNQVLDGVGKMLRRLTREDVALELKPCVDLGTVRVDPSQIEQVILNLVVNASDAMPDGGTLTVATENVRRSEEPDVAIEGKLQGRYAMLSVADTGLGMAPDVKARVFEPFFTTKERGHGTGLGLATVYGIVSQSGGLIELDTKPGDGSIFRVLLPQIEEQGTTPAPGLGALPGGTERILVVEDELEVRRLVAKMLERLGYHVVIAENGAAALSACRHGEEPLDLVLTDVVMPKMSGPECVNRLKALYPDLGVLYMSGHAEQALDHRGVLEPGVALVHKPFTLEALASRLRQALDSRVEASP